MNFQVELNRVFLNDTEGKLIAEVTFPIVNGVAEINHTFVDESLRGQGVAGQLLILAVESIREQGIKAHPTCSYAIKWLEKHSECQDIVL